MGNYERATDNLEMLVAHQGGTKSWSLDQVLRLTQIQATLAIAESVRGKEGD